MRDVRHSARRFVARGWPSVTVSGAVLTLCLVLVPTASAHPGHEADNHVDPIYTLLLVAGLCLLAGSTLLLTRDTPGRSRFGAVLALVGVAMTAIGASAWL